MTLALGRAGAPRPGGARLPWRPAADRFHGAAASAVLAGTALLYLASPPFAAALRSGSGALLLVGGALIGVPHGSSDFVVARRALRPALGRRWLPGFLAAYLALVGLVMAGWALAPLPALIGFLAVSGLHFASDGARGDAGSPLMLAVRATTPVLPIFLIHPAGVASFLAVLGSVSEPATLHLLHALRPPLLPLWGAALATESLPSLLAGGRRAVDAAVLLSTALAAAVLPPLLAFGLYFCLVHAVRHMLEIAGDRHPRRPGAAAALAAGIVAPSALACLLALSLSWDGLAGFLGTDAVVAGSLRLVAALTVPHMALEWWAGRRG